MDIKGEFKEFVKKNPSLIKYVRNGSKSWQDFFELYSLYGEDNSAWNDFLSINSSSPVDFVSWLKGIDLDGIQSGVESLQRVLGVVQDFTNKDVVSTDQEYKPRPLYKHFED